MAELADHDEVILMIDAGVTDERASEYNINEALPEDERRALASMIERDYLDVFRNGSKFSGYAMKIKLNSDVPVYSHPRRLSFKEKQEVQKTINDLLEQGIIRPSESPYASPIVLVRKKSGDLRMCVDYRALNKLTVRDHFPLPVIEDCLEYFGGKKYYSTYDLESGFHHVPMHEDSIQKTAFVTPMGQYEYCRMPFGLTNSPPVFQRFIALILKPLIDANKISVHG